MPRKAARLLSTALFSLILSSSLPAVAASASPVAQAAETVTVQVRQDDPPVVILPCNPCDGTYRFVNVATNRCLDSSNAGSAYTRPCNGNNYQLWKGVVVGGTLWKNVATGRCLKAPSTGGASTASCNQNDPDQVWAGVFTTNPTRIVRINGGQCLDSNAAGNVYTLSCNGGSYQLWRY